ncbi:MAG: carbamoyltransferase HypF [Pseudonocardia sp.]|nr:carbamoyltransferase HypF [Pseudonocardia sp.]
MIRLRVRVAGIVQGVGFRPFVHGLASGLGLSGFVGNDESGVFVEAEGEPEALDKLLDELARRPPPLAVVESVTSREIPVVGGDGFTIVASTAAGQRATLISPDTATCDACLAELYDPANRRYRYPFINCTHCGPRFTIVTGVPYDRPATTMAGFPMCPACAAEYHDPADRRFHAQPTCCPDCGPAVVLLDASGASARESAVRSHGAGADAPIAAAAALLTAGAVLAVKGLGGFHLAALATGPVGERAVATLRARKHREDKPFALLVADLAAARELVDVDDAGAELLASRRRPIVLLPRRTGNSEAGANSEPGTVALASAVAPGNASLGVMLPYTPLHHLLIELVAQPIVLTSGNVSDEPIAFRDNDAIQRLRGIADGFLTHNRAIHMRADDSVVRVVAGRTVPIRRSRGYAPQPLTLASPATRPILGCGAELKNTFCLAKGTHAFVSHHIGDLENYETLRSYTTGIEHFRELFDVTPRLLAHDLHPEYLSTKYALEQAAVHGVELLGIQHHHAHLASCLADNAVAGPAIGIACDGLGYGCDAQLWGGEIMRVSLADFERLAHLEPVPLPGGAAAIREPWRMAAAYLWVCDLPAPPALVARQGARWGQLTAVLTAGVNSPPTSSTGRLFDAVAALLGLRDRINYEGQAAIELEQLAWLRPARDGYLARLDGPLLRGTDLVRGVLDDVAAGTETPVIAARFHAGLVDLLARAASAARERTGLDTVALSGGVFQNALLLTGLCARLEADGFTVLTHSRVPPNDAGISLGQVAVAIARDQNR